MENIEHVGYGIAALAGLLSFLSPCVLPLVPPYLAYIAGVSLDQINDEQNIDAKIRRNVFISAIGFVLGFSTVFISLGAASTLLGQFINQYLTALSMVAGTVIILFGFHFLGVFKLSFLYRELRFHHTSTASGPFGAYILGLAFAFGWTPCIGPILGAILPIASISDTMTDGIILLGFYSAGLAIPFLIAALFAPQFIRWSQKFKKNLRIVEIVIGTLLIVTGLLFLNNNGWIHDDLPSMTSMGFYLLEYFPALQNIEGVLISE